LDVDDRIRVRFSASERIEQAIAKHTEFLKQELLADSIESVPQTGDGSGLAEGADVNAGGEKLQVHVEKV